MQRRALFKLVAALPVVAATRGLAQVPQQAPHFPPPVPDLPTSHIEDTPEARRNVEIVRRQLGLNNAGKFAEAAQLFAPDTRNHGVAVGRAGVLRVLADIFATFPDFRQEEVSLMAAGDEVVVRMYHSGTHLGVGKIPVNGGLLVGVPPTGKKYKVQAIHWMTLKDGLIVEHRANRDDLGMMQQLGLLPMTTRYDLPKVS